MQIRVSHIFIYPIKSTRGIPVQEVQLDRAGPVGDRRWMLVDANGEFLSQRTLPRMTLICARPEPGSLVVTAPGMPTLVVSEWAGEGEWIPVRIWKDALKLPHPNQRWSEWFSSFLGQPCRLVHLPDTVVRPIEPPFDSADWRVSLADAYPLLLLTQASLDELNQRLAAAVGVERFRPNLVISGTAPHAEDGWKTLKIGSIELSVVKPCARCSTVLVNPATAEVGREPLNTLARYRTVQQKVMFAQNALVIVPGLLRVGAEIQVIQS